MRMVRPCPRCSGPVTVKMVRCPSCQQTNLRGVFRRAATWVTAFVGGLTVSSTLAACYGAPCAEDGDPTCGERNYVPTCAMASSQPQIDDKDGDGYCKLQDCNENDKSVNAAASEIMNDGIDQNCNGTDAR
jgi:hypothetical protein